MLQKPEIEFMGDHLLDFLDCSMTDLNKLFLFRMTHIENIPHVLEHGLTHHTSLNRNPAFIPIGDGSLIDKRASHLLPNQKRLGDYIPFYFGPRMPMLYVIQNGHSQVSRVSAEKIVYCITSVADVMACPSVDFLFTNGHAYSGLSEFFTPANVPDIERIVDRQAVRSQYWNDSNDLDLRRRMEAEFLVLGDLPPSAIRGYVVYNQQAATTLSGYKIQESQMDIRPGYYF